MNHSIVTFKSNLPSFTLLVIDSDDFEAVKQAVRNKVKQAPMMFIGMQVIADFSQLSEEEQRSWSIKDFSQYLLGEGLNLVAVMSDKASHREAALADGIGALPMLNLVAERKKNVAKSSPKTVETNNDAPSAPAPQSAETDNVGINNATVGNVGTETQPVENNTEKSEEPRKLSEDVSSQVLTGHNQVITHPVRSGQRIYSKGDLTVIGAVSPGAEIIAEGNIHVYGALRGRAIAGVQGDEHARIFCSQLDAELLAIAGIYKPNDEIDDNYRQKNVQIALENEKICFLTL